MAVVVMAICFILEGKVGNFFWKRRENRVCVWGALGQPVGAACWGSLLGQPYVAALYQVVATLFQGLRGVLKREIWGGREAEKVT